MTSDIFSVIYCYSITKWLLCALNELSDSETVVDIDCYKYKKTGYGSLTIRL